MRDAVMAPAPAGNANRAETTPKHRFGNVTDAVRCTGWHSVRVTPNVDTRTERPCDPPHTAHGRPRDDLCNDLCPARLQAQALGARRLECLLRFRDEHPRQPA